MWKCKGGYESDWKTLWYSRAAHQKILATDSTAAENSFKKHWLCKGVQTILITGLMLHKYKNKQMLILNYIY